MRRTIAQSNSNFLSKIFSALLVVWLCKPAMANWKSFEWNKVKIVQNVLLNYSFNNIQLNSEACQRVFRNCVQDLNKDNDTGFNTDKSLDECFPLKKSSYCLHQKHYEHSRCSFNMISKKMENYMVCLDKEIETCNKWYPFKNNEENKPKNENPQSPKSTNDSQILLIGFASCVVVSLVAGVMIWKLKHADINSKMGV